MYKPEKKVEIGKGKEKRKVPTRYVPKTLSKKERKKQVESIIEGKDRPNQEKKTRRSGWAVKFEKKYGTNIMDDKFIEKNIIRKEGKEKILDKGRGAYYSSGSRPFVSAEQWARGRLASVIMGGKARRRDLKIWNEFKIN
tara:strand:+ start:305 stop:724 length:420 start_codon:yes stop_codon:yes gene_type:complete